MAALSTCRVFCIVFALFFSFSSSLYAKERIRTTPLASALDGASYNVAFSPEKGGTQLVVSLIRSAWKTIRVAAYSFTSREIGNALVDAYRHGVDVEIVADKELADGKSEARWCASKGVPVRIDFEHDIQHNKFIVADDTNIETGSFNFTWAAETKNAENVLVIWNSPSLAQDYADEWSIHWNHAKPMRP